MPLLLVTTEPDAKRINQEAIEEGLYGGIIATWCGDTPTLLINRKWWGVVIMPEARRFCTHGGLFDWFQRVVRPNMADGWGVQDLSGTGLSNANTPWMG